MLQKKLVHYLNKLLEIQKYKDYCPNGLQVEGTAEIKNIMTGVTACQRLIKSAIERKADTILVHHGYFWKSESPCITHIKQQRIKLLLENNINLISYHLPLDYHIELGNNVQLAKILDLNITEQNDLIFASALDESISPQHLSRLLETKLQRKPLHIDIKNQQINKIAWCTGGAQSFIEKAFEMGANAYISGEISESTVHTARELGIHYYSAGHHATEKYGIKALGEHLAEKFSLQHEFIDIYNPV
jgi:dinuclear metal center YbgI/SA1388 family protein